MLSYIQLLVSSLHGMPAPVGGWDRLGGLDRLILGQLCFIYQLLHRCVNASLLLD
jgi:hypothetical protein